MKSPLALVIAALTVVLGVVSIGPLLSGQERAAPAPASSPGRYAVTSVSDDNGKVWVTMCDTTTGQCWIRHTSAGQWTEWPSPSMEARREAAQRAGQRGQEEKVRAEKP